MCGDAFFAALHHAVKKAILNHYCYYQKPLVEGISISVLTVFMSKFLLASAQLPIGSCSNFMAHDHWHIGSSDFKFHGT